MDGRKDELARAKAETEENLKSTKEQNDRFWQCFLEKRKTHPRDPPWGSMLKKTSWKIPNALSLEMGGGTVHTRQVSTHTHPLEARDLDGNSIMD